MSQLISVSSADEVFKVSASLTMLNLREKHVSDAVGKLLAKELEINQTLQSLDLGRNELGEAAGKALARLLKVNRVLRSLYLNWNELGDAAGKELAEALEKNHTLTLLDVHLTNLGIETGKALAVSLRVNTTLLMLDLNWNELGNKGGKRIAKALMDNHTLEVLRLSGNHLGKKAGKAFAQALKINRTLRTLELGGNEIGEEAGEALAETLEVNSTLQVLELWDNALGDKTGLALALVLLTNRTLLSLNVKNNHFGEVTGKALATALRTNQTLQKLYLGNNFLNDRGGSVIVKELETNKTLQSLDLSNNKLGWITGSALIDMLIVNRTIQLNISENEFDLMEEAIQFLLQDRKERMPFNSAQTPLKLDLEQPKKGAAELLKNSYSLLSSDFSKKKLDDEEGNRLAKALETDHTLQSLDLSWNYFGEKTGKALAQALKVNRTLTWLNLENNSLNQKAGTALAEALKVNQTLQFLDLSINRIDEKAGEALEKALRVNRTLIFFKYSYCGFSALLKDKISRHIQRNWSQFQSHKEGILKKFKELLDLSNTNSARYSLCRLANISSIHYMQEKKQILHNLLKLLSNDTLQSNCANGIIDSTSILMAQFEIERFQLETREFRQLLLSAYGNILDLIVLHLAKQHLTLPTRFKCKLEQINEDLAKLEEKGLFISFQIRHIREATVHLLCEDSQLEDLMNKVRAVSEALYDFQREPRAIKQLRELCLLPKTPESWYRHFLHIRQLVPAARTSTLTLHWFIIAMNASNSPECTLKGLELLYFSSQENNREVKKIANDALQEKLASFGGDAFHQIRFFEDFAIASEAFLKFHQWK